MITFFLLAYCILLLWQGSLLHFRSHSPSLSLSLSLSLSHTHTHTLTHTHTHTHTCQCRADLPVLSLPLLTIRKPINDLSIYLNVKSFFGGVLLCLFLRHRAN